MFGQAPNIPAMPADSVIDISDRLRNTLQFEGLGFFNANTVYNDLLAGLWRGDELDRAIHAST